MPNYELKAVSFSFSESGGVVSVERNVEGTADGFGTVRGTVTITGVESGSGTLKFVAVNYPESGPRSISISTGEWTQLSATKIATTGTGHVRTGEATTAVKSQGEYDLTTLIWSGTFDQA